MNLARIYANANKPAKMLAPLRAYLKQKPKDYTAWMDLATINLLLNKRTEAEMAIQEALRVGGKTAEQAILRDQRLSKVAIQMMQKQNRQAAIRINQRHFTEKLAEIMTVYAT